MKWIILAMAGFSSFLFFLWLAQRFLMSNKRLNKRMKRYLAYNDQKKLDLKKFNVLVQMRVYKQSVRDKMLTKPKNDKLATQLERSGLPLKPEEYVLFRWVITGLVAGLLFLITAQMFFLFLGALAGYLGPGWFLRKKQSDRLRRFNDSLPDMITTIIGSLRAGFSFAQSLKTVIEECDSPIREEMELVLKELQYGSSLEDAMHQLKERMPSEDLDLMIQSILIQRQVGGNLATVLEKIVETIRDRNKIQRQILTLTAQGRLSGIVIGCLPVVVGILIYMMEPDYMGSFFNHPLGIMMISGGAVSGLIGFVLIRKMTKIEV